MNQVELLQQVLEAALKVEDEETERLADDGKARMASEHFHRARGIMYAIQLMVDPYYLRKQAEILDVLPAPAPKAKAPRDIDAETAQILEIERELRRPKIYQPRIEAMRQKGIG